ncbi:bifunctional 2-polyprenyl-6-hydroxyphenol methylase/3-demethylubiquinol 3-O-methyltransferase UbiG [Polynucleobacter sp. AP-Titi-500A-B4]|uniref:class I SAM-dependent methyltransferase n=1 Tax=Polynucleobacter sp. AP-Titi-500A-B4 TaxID=2576923 RepID=UPI001BFE9293|nr:class I SAM-dependent methyltransferase [Polynucleobacter sp. AP-Titi-500A-B4]QWE12829.1 class I SAM-dependent methyltransferase [Polynucleobacter sp. AP-Titi-500A-B4]
MKKNTNFTEVTEFPDELVTQQQIDRFVQRYFWSVEYCKGKTILEVACGSGPGLPLIASVAKQVFALDIDKNLLSVAKKYNPNIVFFNDDIESHDFRGAKYDVIMIHEAIYYFEDPIGLLKRLKEILHPNGVILISSVNPSIEGFNKSQFSKNYLDISAYINAANELDMKLTVSGGFELAALNKNLSFKFRQKLKKLASSFGLIPKSMRGKRILKRIFFGRLSKMPVLKDKSNFIGRYIAPQAICKEQANDLDYEILYISLTLNS